MVGWHHQLNGHKFRWTPGVGDGQGGLACCIPWGHKESDKIEQLNWTTYMQQGEQLCVHMCNIFIQNTFGKGYALRYLWRWMFSSHLCEYPFHFVLLIYTSSITAPINTMYVSFHKILVQGGQYQYPAFMYPEYIMFGTFQ